MRVLVTGGAGYIGSVVAAQLLAAGHEVTILDDLSTGHADAVPQGANFVKGTLRDCAAEVLADGADAVVHLAAKSLVGESMTDPAKYWSGNLGATLTLLEAMRVIGVRSIVFSSTAAVYGEPERTPVLETDPLRPTSPYGGSKTAIDTTLTEFARLFGLAPVSLRYFNVAGAHRVAGEGGGWLGERHNPETHLIPNVLAAAVEGRPVNIFGTDYPTPDGTCVRDYIHVTDVADAHLRALDACEPGRHRIYNLGSQAGFSVREVIDVCRDVTGLDVAVTEAGRRPGDPAVLVASSERIKAELSWAPTRDLRTMAADAWQFTQAQAQAQADRAAAAGPDQSGTAAEGSGQSGAASAGLGQSGAASEGSGQSGTAAVGQSGAASAGPDQSSTVAEGSGQSGTGADAEPSPEAPGPATS